MEFLDLAIAMSLFISGFNSSRVNVSSFAMAILTVAFAFAMFVMSAFFADKYIHYIITLLGD